MPEGADAIQIQRSIKQGSCIRILEHHLIQSKNQILGKHAVMCFVRRFRIGTVWRILCPEFPIETYDRTISEPDAQSIADMGRRDNNEAMTGEIFGRGFPLQKFLRLLDRLRIEGELSQAGCWPRCVCTLFSRILFTHGVVHSCPRLDLPRP